MSPRIDLEPYKAEILDLLDAKHTHEAIVATLLEKYRLSIGISTFRSHIRPWRAARIKKTDIQEQVDTLARRLSTREILTVLRNHGTPSSERTVRRARGDLGIQLRLTALER
jgi:hypothetical protein